MLDQQQVNMVVVGRVETEGEFPGIGYVQPPRGVVEVVAFLVRSSRGMTLPGARELARDQRRLLDDGFDRDGVCGADVERKVHLGMQVVMAHNKGELVGTRIYLFDIEQIDVV